MTLSTGCGPTLVTPDKGHRLYSDYKKLESLRITARTPFEMDIVVAEFQKYKLEDRIELYNMFYDASSKPQYTVFSTGFQDNPDETLRLVGFDIETRGPASWRRYRSLIYFVSHAPGYDICKSKHIGKIRDAYASSIGDGPADQIYGQAKAPGCYIFK